MSDAWERFEGAARGAGRIERLFAAEPERLKRTVVEAAGLRLDVSKTPLSAAALDAGLALLEAAEFEARRAALFGGAIVNVSEHRPALHMALRAPDGADYRAEGAPVSGEVEAARAKMRAFAGDVRSGKITGASGRRLRAIVHIGIGGSDLGPRLLWEALRSLAPEFTLRFAANVDGTEIAQALEGLDPGETLVIAVSKTFTTLETLANAEAARAWLRAELGEAGANLHMAAVSANVKGAGAFGIAESRVFPFWDWVGGRYSVWSAVGLSCAVGLGWDVFQGFLDGAAAMDAHFRDATPALSAPVLLALAHVCSRNGLGRPVRAVVPYARRLTLLPAFLQQLEMESNGKRVTDAGKPVEHGTAAAVFGDAGTNGQHAFFQLLHQGSEIIPLDIVAVARNDEGPPGAHAKLLANAIAQGEALMVGRSEAEVRAELAAKGLNPAEIEVLAPQRAFPGDRPSVFVLLERLTPRALGALIALYEHKVFVEGVLWGIDSFDQWGVELGKSLATRVLGELEGGANGKHDPSTAALIGLLKTD